MPFTRWFYVFCFVFVDSYLYLNKEELTDVLNTILNRAVRYYGVVHDVILEIIEILSGELINYS